MAMLSGISLSISVLSLGIAGLAIWLAHFRLGKIRMPLPSLVYFGFEGSKPKILLRAILHCTSPRGRAVESLYLKVRRNEFTYIFDLHGYTESKELLIGSGMFVTQTGVNYNFHYMLRSNQPFVMLPGPCDIEAMVKFPNSKRPVSLNRFSIEIGDTDIVAFAAGKADTLYRLRPDTANYRREDRSS